MSCGSTETVGMVYLGALVGEVDLIPDGVSVLNEEQTERMEQILDNGVLFKVGEDVFAVAFAREGIHPVMITGRMNESQRELTGQVWFRKKDQEGDELIVPFKMYKKPNKFQLVAEMDQLCDMMEDWFWGNYQRTGDVRLFEFQRSLISDLGVIFDNAGKGRDTLLFNSKPGRRDLDALRLLTTEDVPSPLRNIMNWGFVKGVEIQSTLPVTIVGKRGVDGMEWEEVTTKPQASRPLTSDKNLDLLKQYLLLTGGDVTAALDLLDQKMRLQPRVA